MYANRIRQACNYCAWVLFITALFSNLFMQITNSKYCVYSVFNSLLDMNTDCNCNDKVNLEFYMT